MNKGLWKLRIDISYRDSESHALADSEEEFGAVAKSLSYLILVTVRHGWVFLKGLGGTGDPENPGPSRETWEMPAPLKPESIWPWVPGQHQRVLTEALRNGAPKSCVSPCHH